MAYPYNPKIAPAIGNGLGGFPQKAAAVATSSSVIVDNGITNSQYVFMYDRNGNIYIKKSTMAGIGTADDSVFATSVGAINSMTMSVKTGHFVCAGTTGQYLQFFKKNLTSSGFTSGGITIDVDPPRSANVVAITRNGNYLAVGLSSGNGSILIYKRNGDSFTLLTTLLTDITVAVSDLKFSDDDTFLICGHNSSPYITLFNVSGDNFTRQDLSFSGLSSVSLYTVAMSNDKSHIITGLSATPWLLVYKLVNGVYTVQSNTVPAYRVMKLSISPNGKYVAAASQTGGNSNIYTLSNGTLTSLQSTGGNSFINLFLSRNIDGYDSDSIIGVYLSGTFNNQGIIPFVKSASNTFTASSRIPFVTEPSNYIDCAGISR